VDHQRIHGTSFVLSASEGINISQNTLSILSMLQENVRAIHGVLDPVEALTIPSYPTSPIIHTYCHSAMSSVSASAKVSVPVTPAHDATPFDIAVEECLPRGIMDEALTQRV